MSSGVNFWDNLPEPFFCLAPMEDVTDVVFRQVVSEAARPDVFFTEFMNVSGFCHPQGKNQVSRRLEFAPEEQPIVAQIWGSKPEDFAETARAISKLGFSGIDINMGCPDKAVVKSGGGSALIDDPSLSVEIIKAVRENTNLPVSVKTRLGGVSIDEWRSWLAVLLQQDLSALTVHLRTRKEMSKVPAHYELISEIVALRDEISSATKLIINGDVMDREQGLALSKKHSGVDGWMIGRGIFANPFCFEKQPCAHSRQELIGLLSRHLDLFDQSGHQRKFEPLKRFFKIYVNGFNGAKELREKLMATKNTGEARAVLEENRNHG